LLNSVQYQIGITAIKEYASDLQTFLGSKTIEEEVKKEEKYIIALSEDGCLQQLNLKCSMDKKIKDIMSTMTSFTIRANDTSCYICGILSIWNIKCIM
jgi:hypothetical protein